MCSCTWCVSRCSLQPRLQFWGTKEYHWADRQLLVRRFCHSCSQCLWRSAVYFSWRLFVTRCATLLTAAECQRDLGAAGSFHLQPTWTEHVVHCMHDIPCMLAGRAHWR